VPREAAAARFDALVAGFAAVLELPFEKRQLFNVLHSVAAVEDPRDGVLRLEDYAARGLGDRRLRVLVADDNPTNRTVIGKILERGGHDATLVNDGEDALQAMERARFDVVLLDRNMPGLGGIETLQALRLMTPSGERLPIAILSADVTPDAKREAMEAGADAFFPKPIEVARLLKEIQSLGEVRAGHMVRAESVRAESETVLRPARRTTSSAPEIVNLQTLGNVEQLGSSPDFVAKLIRVFLTDNKLLLGRIEQAVSGRNFHEIRALVHAFKGSSASMGTDRLTASCVAFERLSDSELRLQAAALLRSLGAEFAVCQSHLEHYLRDKQKSAG